MKTLVLVAAISMVFFTFGVPPVRSQTMQINGYTIVMGTGGPVACLGNWVQSSVLRSGLCDGPMVDMAQLTAISATQTADKLDQLLGVLTSIDEKMAVNNDEMRDLIQATTSSRTSTEQRDKRVGELLRRTITNKFDALPGKTMANEELVKLREGILRDIEEIYSLPPVPAK